MRPPRRTPADSRTAASNRTAPVVRPRILLVNADQATLDEVALALGADCDVVAVRDGAGALALARQGSWDLVLTNVIQPQLDGLAQPFVARIAVVPHPPHHGRRGVQLGFIIPLRRYS